MILTEETFNLFAAKHYDNPFCFNEEEFLLDVKRISTIKRMISWYNNGDKINLRLLLNNVISFYNVFEHHAASQMCEFKMNESHYKQMNSMLFYLSYPLLNDGEFDLLLHRKISKDVRNS